MFSVTYIVNIITPDRFAQAQEILSIIQNLKQEHRCGIFARDSFFSLIPSLAFHSISFFAFSVLYTLFVLAKIIRGFTKQNVYVSKRKRWTKTKNRIKTKDQIFTHKKKPAKKRDERMKKKKKNQEFQYVRWFVRVFTFTCYFFALNLLVSIQ